MELAGDPLAMRLILQSWDEEAKMQASFSLGFDFLFMFLYSTTLALACVWASEQTTNRTLVRAGIVIAWAQWVAGLLDAGENTGLLFVLFVSPGSPWPELARLCAIPKFLLVGVGVLYAALGVVLNRFAAAARSTQHALTNR